MAHNWSRNASLRSELRGALAGDGGSRDDRIDVVCTHSEVNSQHGTGILVERLFQRPGPGVVSIRAQSDWGSEQEFGLERLEIPPAAGRRKIYDWTLDQLGGRAVRHVHCIPFGEPEIHAALAVRDACQVPLCLYIMDDQNIAGEAVSDELMAEAIDKATLRLAISSDMRDAYEAKYARRFWLAPPTIPDGVEPAASRGHRGRAVIVGNLWAREWVSALAEAIRSSGLRVDWFCNAPRGGQWIDLATLGELDESGVTLRDPLPAPELARRLPDYEVALMPTVGALDRRQGVPVALLSLPSRIPLLIGAGEVPIIVLGAADTHAGRFVTHFGIGVTCSYRSDELLRAITTTRDEAWRGRQRQSLVGLRRILGATDIAAWLQSSLAFGRVMNPVFEALTVEPPRYVRRYLPEPSPALGPWLHGFEPVRSAFGRLAAQGYEPDFIIDGGASTGVWSYAASHVFPNARFVLVEPLLSRYDQAATERGIARLPQADVCQCALGDVEREGELRVGDSLYQARLNWAERPAEDGDDPAGRNGDQITAVPIRKLDSLARELGLSGRGILKLDIQGGELDALRGGQNLLDTQVDAVVAEVTIDPPEVGAPSFADVDLYLREAGFTLLDELGSWREPTTGTLLEKDVLYMKHDHPIAQARKLAGLG